MTDLFKVEESLSPKLKWMKEHEIKVHHFKEWEPDIFDDVYEWCAYKKRKDADSYISVGYGENEEEALWQLSQNLKIPFYK